jgi:microcystin-dependent protein
MNARPGRRTGLTGNFSSICPWHFCSGQLAEVLEIEALFA